MSEDVTVRFKAPAGWAESKRLQATHLGTGDLPPEVTSQEVVIACWLNTERINERGRPEGWYSYSLKFGDRENPNDLSDDERAYVVAILERAASDFRQGYNFDPDPGVVAEDDE